MIYLFFITQQDIYTHTHMHSHKHRTHMQSLFIRVNFVSVCVYLPSSACGVSPVSFPEIRMTGA